MEQSETYHLDGREFRGVSQALTANQDDYILAHLRLAGAVDILHEIDGKKRTQQERAEELLTAILLSGRTHHILAGCLTEDGKVWSRKEADANATRFANITDHDEKIHMRQSLIEFVIGFFSQGVLSSETSQKSSSRGKAPRTKSAAH